MKKANPPDINIRKLGIVSRDYNVRFPNGYRYFSHVWHDVLTLLDDNGCDAVLFSLYTLEPRPDFDPYAAFKSLSFVKLVCIEEFKDRPRGRKPEELFYSGSSQSMHKSMHNGLYL